MKWLPADCAAGDMVRVQIGSIYHYGVFVSEREVIAFGLPPVPAYDGVENRYLVTATDADTFCCGKILEVAVLDRSERRKRIPPEETVRLARARLGEGGYHLIRNNCEHFAYECVFGEKKSLQEEAVFARWNQRKIANVYLMRAECAKDQQVPVPPERQAEIDACSDAGMKLSRTADWLLLRLAAKHAFSLDPDSLVFSKDKNGVWTCDRFSFSFSHADGFVAVAVSNAPIGVDLETLKSGDSRFTGDRLNRLRARCFTKAERNAYPETAEGFLCCWTRKEAIFKSAHKRVFSPGRTDSLAMEGLTLRFREECGPILSVSGQNAAHALVYRSDGSSVRLAEYDVCPVPAAKQ